MSGMVLTPLLNPESGIDRPGADASAAAGRGRPDNGPSRYDEVARQQEKRLEQRRAQERAQQRDRQQQATERNDDADKAIADEHRTRPSEPAAKERRPDSDRRTAADAGSEKTSATEAGAATGQAGGDGDSRQPVSETGVQPLLELPQSGEQALIPGMMLPGALPEQSLASPGTPVQSAAQVMASLTGTGRSPGGLPTPGALFAAMLESGQEKTSQGRELMASLQGSSLQALSETTGKAADNLTAQLATRMTAPELPQSPTPGASLRGTDAQALMRSYSTSVDVPVGQSEWGEKVMGKLAWLTASQVSVAEIHVTPPDLGPLEVRVQVQNDQATVTVHASTQAVRDQLELHGHRLRDMLSEQGLSLDGFDVSDSAGREAADQQGEGDEAADGQHGQTLADGDSLTGADDGTASELDLSWRGELDLYA